VISIWHRIGYTIAFGLFPATVWAGNICWIEKVEAVPDGIEIHFIENWQGSCFRLNNKTNSDQCPIAEDKGKRRVKLALGDKVYVAQSPHDVCPLEVIEQQGRIGVQAKASVYLHGFGSNTSEKFIEAQEP
jgi:hypothetical protein